MVLFEFIFLGLLILTMVLLLAHYCSKAINSLNSIENTKTSPSMLWFFLYAFFCIYYALKTYSSQKDLNFFFILLTASIPAWVVIIKNYIYPNYNTREYLNLIINNKNDVIRVLQLNHPKLKMYSFVVFATIIFLMFEFSLMQWSITILVSTFFLFFTNVMFSSKYAKYDSIITLVESDSFDKMKEQLVNNLNTLNLVNLFYAYHNMENDLESCVELILKYKNKHGLGKFKKNVYEKIIKSSHNFKGNDYILEVIDDLNIKEICNFSYDIIHIILNVLVNNNRINKVKKILLQLATIKNIELDDVINFYQAKMELINKNYHFAKKYLTKIKNKTTESVNLELEVDFLLNHYSISSIISIDRNDYVILDEDYKRQSEKDKFFLKKYKMMLLEIFNNSCAKSASQEEIEIDHFFIPKNEGGAFLLKHKNGKYIVNAIPLSKRINGSKSDKKIGDFFSSEEILNIFKKLEILNDKINQDKIEF